MTARELKSIILSFQTYVSSECFMNRQTRVEESDARTRLLEAAERLFADRGLEATSVRDLAREARVNVAAVNYYFGSKENLYLEALRHSFICARQETAVFERIVERARAAGTRQAGYEGIREFVKEFMYPLTYTDEAGCHLSLMAREMTSPTPALDVIIEEFIKPKSKAITELVAIARPDLVGTEKLSLTAISIVAQCLHYKMTQPVTLKLMGASRLTPELIDRISAHIADFSINALRGGA